MNSANLENEKNEESLEERSARLEAEAQAMTDAAHDPLAPEPVEGEDPADIDEPEHSEVEELQAALAHAKDQVMRALADAENTRRRAQRDREDASKFAISNFARDMLNVADNLRRALDSVPEDNSEFSDRLKALIEGIEATEREMLRNFEKHGIKKVDPMGEPFNPNLHEVMFETPGTGQPPGTIIQVIETGYVLNERILRPARVGVAKDEGQGDGTPGHSVDTEA